MLVAAISHPKPATLNSFAIKWRKAKLEFGNKIFTQLNEQQKLKMYNNRGPNGLPMCHAT